MLYSVRLQQPKADSMWECCYHQTSLRYRPSIWSFFTIDSVFDESRPPWNTKAHIFQMHNVPHIYTHATVGEKHSQFGTKVNHNGRAGHESLALKTVMGTVLCMHGQDFLGAVLHKGSSIEKIIVLRWQNISTSNNTYLLLHNSVQSPMNISSHTLGITAHVKITSLRNYSPYLCCLHMVMKLI
jgi:predicted nuclease of predicted toxin-antitoxin system